MQQYRVFDMEKLSKVLRQNGFEIISNGSYFLKPFTHNQMEQLLSSEIFDSRVIEGLNKMTKYLPEFGSEIFVNCKITKK